MISLLPWRAWSSEVTPGSLKQDALAGLTCAFFLLPQGIAYATIAGLPAEYGIWGALVPAVVAALMGSSRLLVTGPTASASIVVAGALTGLAVVGGQDYVMIALTLTLMVGVIKLVIALTGLSALIARIDEAIVLGFTIGAACLIASSQIGALLGIAVPRGLSFGDTLAHAFKHLGDARWQAIGISLFTLLASFLARRYLKRFPYMLVALAAGALLAEALVAAGHQVATLSKPAGALPPFSVPPINLALLAGLAVSAIAIAHLGVVEAVSIARSFDARSGAVTRPDQESFGQGLANIAGAFTSGYLSSGSFSRTVIHAESGARTPLANVFNAGFVLIAALLAGNLITHLPLAALAAMLLLVSIALVDTAAIGRIWNSGGRRFALLVITLAAALIWRVEYAVLVGLAASLLLRTKSKSHDE